MFKKTTILIILLSMILSISLISAESTPEIYFELDKISYDINDVFDIDLWLDSKNTSIDAWLINELTYQPAGIIHIINITMSDDWSFSEEGTYNNNNGILTNTQGFDINHTTNKTLFATITFKAIKSGTVNIENDIDIVFGGIIKDCDISNTQIIIKKQDSPSPPPYNPPTPPPVDPPIEPPEEPPVEPPIVNVSLVAIGNGPYISYTNESITFDASTSYITNGTIDRYIWSFGDGNFSIDMISNHIYTLPGNYSVSLTVWSATDQYDVYESYANITIKEEPFVPNPDPPVDPAIDTLIPTSIGLGIVLIFVLSLLIVLFIILKKINKI